MKINFLLQFCKERVALNVEVFVQDGNGGVDEEAQRGVSDELRCEVHEILPRVINGIRRLLQCFLVSAHQLAEERIGKIFS